VFGDFIDVNILVIASVSAYVCGIIYKLDYYGSMVTLVSDNRYTFLLVLSCNTVQVC